MADYIVILILRRIIATAFFENLQLLEDAKYTQIGL